MPSRPLSALLVAVGGALGSLGRWGLGLALPSPWAVLVVNATGALVIGLLAGAVFERRPALRLLLGVGFLGGWTTFSGHLLDAWLLPPPGAVAYVVGTLVACVLLAGVGLRVGRRFA